MQRTHGPRVLVVDDEPDLLDLMERRLSKAGFEVTQALGGRVGLEISAVREFDVVICDINMPEGIDGFAVLSTLRSRSTPMPKFIFVSGHGEGTPEFMQAFDSRCDAVFAKPLNARELIARIKALCKCE